MPIVFSPQFLSVKEFAGPVAVSNANAVLAADNNPVSDKGAKPSADINKVRKVAKTIGTIKEPTATACFRKVQRRG